MIGSLKASMIDFVTKIMNRYFFETVLKASIIGFIIEILSM